MYSTGTNFSLVCIIIHKKIKCLLFMMLDILKLIYVLLCVEYVCIDIITVPVSY